MKKRLLFTALFLVVLVNNNISSQWSTDPTVNNPICILTSEQGKPSITSDGAGGAIITWADTRNGGFSHQNIYAQRINSSGDTLWTTAPGGGVAVCTNTSGVQTDPSITSDGAGGAIITWIDTRTDGYYDVYAQRINSSGVPQWTTNGVAVCTYSSFAWTASYNPTILGDGSGGAIITWHDIRAGVFDIYAQRIDQSGGIVWTGSPNGVIVCDATGEQRYPKITSDGSTGAIITWYDERNGSGNSDIYAQRINSSGVPQWTTNGVAVCTDSHLQYDPTITSDGSGDAIIAWADNRSGNWDIYAQRIISTDGSSQWTADGVAVCTDASTQQNPSITSDGSGGAIITWSDLRISGGNPDLYAQRINSTNGGSQWTADGVVVCSNLAAQYYPTITSAGSGGAVVAWYDYRNGNNDIYTSKLVSDGSLLPVELTTFTSTKGNDNTIVLHWTTATEVNNYGFEIEKTVISNQQAVASWKKIGFVAGAGTTNAPKEYSYSDKNIFADKYSYRLKQIDRDGKFEYSQSVEVTVEQRPNVFALEQNYPNPFNPSTVISYQLPLSGQASLKVYDAVGREVTTLVNEVKEAGSYTAHFDGTKLSSGIYFARLVSAGKTQMRKLLLMK